MPRISVSREQRTGWHTPHRDCASPPSNSSTSTTAWDARRQRSPSELVRSHPRRVHREIDTSRDVLDAYAVRDLSDCVADGEPACESSALDDQSRSEHAHCRRQREVIALEAYLLLHTADVCELKITAVEVVAPVRQACTSNQRHAFPQAEGERTEEGEYEGVNLEQELPFRMVLGRLAPEGDLRSLCYAHVGLRSRVSSAFGAGRSEAVALSRRLGNDEAKSSATRGSVARVGQTTLLGVGESMSGAWSVLDKVDIAPRFLRQSHLVMPEALEAIERGRCR